MKKILFLLFLLPCLNSLAQVPDPLPNTYVNDLANVLNADQIRSLNEKILSIEKKSSVQIAVILINELPADMEIDQYTLEVGRKWRVGNAGNGLVYVAAINQRKQSLEVANNLQGDIPDIEALRITDNIKPFFRNKDYYGGINELLDGINKRLDPILKEQLALAEKEREKKIQQAGETFVNFLMWLIAIICVFVLVRFVLLRNYFKSRREKREAEEKKYGREKFDYSLLTVGGLGGYSSGAYSKPSYKNDNYTPPQSNNDDSYSKRNNDSDYGNWGSGSSGSDNSSGFSGGGASNDW